MHDEALFSALFFVFGNEVQHAVARVRHNYLKHQDAGLQRCPVHPRISSAFDFAHKCGLSKLLYVFVDLAYRQRHQWLLRMPEDPQQSHRAHLDQQAQHPSPTSADVFALADTVLVSDAGVRVL